MNAYRVMNSHIEFLTLVEINGTVERNDEALCCNRSAKVECALANDVAVFVVATCHNLNVDVDIANA